MARPCGCWPEVSAPCHVSSPEAECPHNMAAAFPPKMSNPIVRRAVYDHCHFHLHCLLEASCWVQPTFKGRESGSTSQSEEEHSICGHILKPPPLVWIWFSVTCNLKSSDRYSGVYQDSVIAVITWLLAKQTNKLNTSSQKSANKAYLLTANLLNLNISNGPHCPKAQVSIYRHMAHHSLFLESSLLLSY